MEDADIVRAKLDQHFAHQVQKARLALAEAEQRLDAWRRDGASSQQDVIAAWKLAASNALATAQGGHDPQPEVEQVQTIRRWALANGYWPADEELPAEVEIALRKALRTAHS